jgi:tRNA (adenine37-N6)-methyltransferase
MPDAPCYTFRPLGFIASPYTRRIDAPHQASVVEGTQNRERVEARLELLETLPLEALRYLEGFERIWLIYVFHLSGGWGPLVRPPRRSLVKRGVLATRSPDRPNPIGLSAVELVKVERRTLFLRGIDLLDGTPVLDVKPYVPYADAFPQAKAGWIDEVDAETGIGWAPGPKRPRRKPRVR